jgi:flagellar biosynthesis/type III secretory pathway M-ring protein FliF/YscJ
VQFHQARIQKALNEIVPNAVVAVNVEFDNVMSIRERTQQIDKGVELTTILETESSSSNEGPAAGTPGTASNQPRSLASSSAQQTSSTDKNERTKSFSAPSMTISETERTPLNEKSLQVAVSIPEGYIEQLVLRDGVPLGTTEQEKAAFTAAFEEEKKSFTSTVTAIVTKLIPPNSPDGSVVVETHRRIEQDVPQLELPFTDMLKDFISTWGSSIALTLFGIWALMLLKKSMPVSEMASSTAALDKLSSTVTTVAAEAAAAELAEKEAARVETTSQFRTDRDTLEMAVENDPAGAAAIISKWLQNA